MKILKKINAILSVKIKNFKAKVKLIREKKYKIVQRSNVLRNIHENKRIFILGTGPSIKEQDLTPLKDEITIALNEFYLHPDIEKIKPKYYLYTGYQIHKETVEYNTAIKWYEDFELCIRRNEGTALLPLLDYDFLKENELMQKNDFEKYYLNYVIDAKKINRYKFDNDILSYYGHNSAINAIALSIYMGANEICLLGLDHDWILTFKDKKQNHFYEDDESLVYKDHSKNFKRNLLMDNLVNYLDIFQQYEAIEKYSLKNNISIFNLTRGGLLDVFRIKNYENYIGKKTKH